MQPGREAQKRAAGEAAAALVTDGMVVGLGTGSTVRYTIEELGRRVQRGLRIQGIATSLQSEELARRCGIPLSDLDQHPEVDLTIDGADEFDPRLDLVKGGGGALTREKMVAHASRRMVVVADEAKRVDVLGTTFALPIEVLAFGATPVRRRIEAMGAVARLRTDPSGRPVRTDNGNPILDAKFPAIPDPRGMQARLDAIPGVVCCGLFVGLCDTVFVAGSAGLEVVRRPRP